jgi:Fic family protein
MHIHERPQWPRFEWDRVQVGDRLAGVRRRQGRLIGRMEGLGFDLRRDRGERLDAEQVRPSIARRLGIDVGGLKPADRHVEGAVEMTLDASGKCDEPLTTERLLGWHASVFPEGRTGMRRIRAGAWRGDSAGAMAVALGPIGSEWVHFEAPAAARAGEEVRAFLEWFNSGAAMDPVERAGLAHLWFVTLHPFEDGNGRIARAIADVALALSEACAQWFYSGTRREDG